METLAAEIIEYYFGGSHDDPTAMEACLARWFEVDRALDAEVAERYGDVVESALEGGFESWRDDPHDCLALILLLDQFPRNVYRGQPRVYAGDERAREVTGSALDAGWAQQHASIPSIFFYMPFEHAEDLALQDRCVAGYEAIHAAAPEAFRPLTARAVQAGKDHRDVIRQFGRFPHRNAILGRPNTREEAAWLAVNRGGWGQGAADLEHQD